MIHFFLTGFQTDTATATATASIKKPAGSAPVNAAAMSPPPLHEAPADAPLDDDGEAAAARVAALKAKLPALKAAAEAELKLLKRPLRELHIESRINEVVALAISEGSKKAPSEDECQGLFGYRHIFDYSFWISD